MILSAPNCNTVQSRYFCLYNFLIIISSYSTILCFICFWRIELDTFNGFFNSFCAIKRNSNNKKNFETKVPIKNRNIIRVLKGPQFDYFSKESQKDFFSKDYKITNLTDRMGMRLEGTTIKNTVSTNIRSEGITKGAIQVPADGQPIVLLTDYPTIGGYPKIANVISSDYHCLVQKIPGEKILFQNVELQKAELLYKEHLNSISEIIKNIKEIN